MTESSLKIAVYGAGAMGTVLGALLTSCIDARVDLVSRNAAHVAGMRERGARIVCTADKREFVQRVNALLPEEMTEEYDVIFLMTKQRENAGILKFLKPRLASQGIVCTTQNGLPEPSVAEAIGEERTYGGVCAWGATFIGEGKVRLTSEMRAMSIEIGGYSGRCEKLALLEEILRKVGERTGNPAFVTTTDNLIGSRWSKLSVNAAFSGLSVATGLTFGEIARRKKSRKVALGILRECFAVADAAGIRMKKIQGHDMRKLLGGDGFFARQRALFLLPIAMRKHKRLVSGMLRDVERGRKCEIDYIDGVVCRFGDRYGIDTPLCDRTTELVHGIENGLYEISYDNLDFFG